MILSRFIDKRLKRTTDEPADLESVKKLNDRIAKLIEREPVASAAPKRSVETRNEKRFAPHCTATSFTLRSGKKFDARIMNMSRFGVALDADFSKIAIEEITLVGKQRVAHVRIMRLGAVFRFETPLDPNICNRTIVL